MRYQELVVGKPYILDNGRVAIYEGRHEGKLDLADGSTYWGSKNYLRFGYVDPEGHKQTLLFENGAAIKEAEETRIERERLQAEREARREAAMAAAVQFIQELGFKVSDKSWEASKDPETVCIRHAQEEVDDIGLDSVSIGKLKTFIKRGQPIAAQV